jgi:hypothetical protein
VSIAPPPVNFHALIAATGSNDGARARFQQLIAQLIHLKHPTVRQIEANPGDWGIDAFVGALNEEVAIWQSKFFINGVDDDQQSQIRDSFETAVKKAKAEGYRLRSWTLCIPVNMDPLATKWWDGWKKRRGQETQVVIELWDQTELESMLISPDAAHVRAAYFGGQAHGLAEPPILAVPSDITYEEMLFVRQLRAAAIPELESAKQQFFNTDLMRREVADKGVDGELQELESCLADTRALWETRFNEKCEEHAGRDPLPSLYSSVMLAIEARHSQAKLRLVPMSLVHRLGTIHHVVEDGHAGWVRSFRAIAAKHFGSDK